MLFHDYNHSVPVKTAVETFCEIRKDFIFKKIYGSIAEIRKI